MNPAYKIKYFNCVNCQAQVILPISMFNLQPVFLENFQCPKCGHINDTGGIWVILPGYEGYLPDEDYFVFVGEKEPVDMIEKIIVEDDGSRFRTLSRRTGFGLDKVIESIEKTGRE